MDKAFQDLLLKEIRDNRKEIAAVKQDMAQMKFDLSLDMNTVKVKFGSITAVVSIVLSSLTTYLYKKFGG
jgi:hypothetical protein